ncbi:hypothetical protein [Thermomonospora cellulosilytica]|uniref:Uncharacterized protein n=1 Tax=Thermomonospora cellulosilytica TaxID=1411118 RepID=A0A7W3MWK5_9ACTN|nr:hypothetical protein [Thermomonospora cellulosilytica]MBA9003206.1 hypothetical protein [Thermomonospora cellulosilytica]
MGRIIRRSKSSVSRFETGEYQLGEAECEALDRAWNTGRLFSILPHCARIGHDPNWLQQYKEQEAQAGLIKTWQSNLGTPPPRHPRQPAAPNLGPPPNASTSAEKTLTERRAPSWGLVDRLCGLADHPPRELHQAISHLH